MPQMVLRRSLILLIVSLYIASSVQKDSSPVNDDENILLVAETSNEDLQKLLRTKRAIKNGGFFRTLFSVLGEQYADTKNTFKKVNDMINDNLFLPENEPVTEATTKSSDPNATTTMAPYKISRTELNRIINRNLGGLVRLFNIELQDSLKQSVKNRAEYNKNVSKEISRFL